MNIMKSYKTVKQPAEAEFIEKKSRFISFVYPISAENEAISLLETARKKYYDSTHVVYAYKLKDNNISRFSDDGEPQGTAGVPVLEVINKSELVDVLVISVRYFGGTMLGAGGLIRAYSKSAHIGIEAAGIIKMAECVKFFIDCPYHMLGKIEYVLINNNANKIDIEYGENVKLNYYIEADKLEKLKKEISDASNGGTELFETDRSFYNVI